MSDQDPEILSLDVLLREIRKLSEAVAGMEARGERIPCELEEGIYTLEELVRDMIKDTTKH